MQQNIDSDFRRQALGKWSVGGSESVNHRMIAESLTQTRLSEPHQPQTFRPQPQPPGCRAQNADDRDQVQRAQASDRDADCVGRVSASLFSGVSTNDGEMVRWWMIVGME